MRQFNVAIDEKISPNEFAKDFGDMSLEKTPTFDKYEDNSIQETMNEPLEEIETTPDLSTDVYLNTYIVFPRGERLSWAKVVRRKRDVDGNTIRQENKNPIIDNYQYEVEFNDGEVTGITENVISDWMYARCEKYINDMFLLDYFVDY